MRCGDDCVHIRLRPGHEVHPSTVMPVLPDKHDVSEPDVDVEFDRGVVEEEAPRLIGRGGVHQLGDQVVAEPRLNAVSEIRLVILVQMVPL